MEVSVESPKMAPWMGKVPSNQEVQEARNDVPQSTQPAAPTDRHTQSSAQGCWALLSASPPSPYLVLFPLLSHLDFTSAS